MLNRNYWMLIIFAFLLFSCNKDNPNEPSETVNISQILFDKTAITVRDTVKLECIDASSDALHYHWILLKGNIAYDSNIIDKANNSSSFDFGKWIKWQPPSSGTWTIEVLAYLSSADHNSSGTGKWKIYYEYDSYGIKVQHCFNYAEQGKLWDIKSISMSVGY
jgi:hypothetical protein